jgi:hypothetical protein
LEYKKDKILSEIENMKNNGIHTTPTVMRVAEALVEDGGTATK